MTNPVLMVVDDNPDNLSTLEEALRTRYERDYVIISEVGPGQALDRLRALAAAGNAVAVVMASSAMTATDAAEFLAQVLGAG